LVVPVRDASPTCPEHLCCAIRSQIELGIEATFWDANEEPTADVLPLVRPG
jgi:hypothetical protein